MGGEAASPTNPKNDRTDKRKKSILRVNTQQFFDIFKASSKTRWNQTIYGTLNNKTDLSNFF